MRGRETLAVLAAGAVLGGGVGAEIQFRTQAEARDRASAVEACINAYHDRSGGSMQQTSDCMKEGWIGEVVPPISFDNGTPRQFFDGYISLERSRGDNFDPEGTLMGAFGGFLLMSWAISRDERKQRRQEEDESQIPEVRPDKLTSFEIDGDEVAVSYVNSGKVAEGVECDEYRVVGCETLDLGIVHVQPHMKTPKQKVLTGTRTLEGFISGSGTLIVTPQEGGRREYHLHFPLPEDYQPSPPVEVKVGDTMQWIAGERGLTFYEICEPPYMDGRFLNLDE